MNKAGLIIDGSAAEATIAQLAQSIVDVMECAYDTNADQQTVQIALQMLDKVVPNHISVTDCRFETPA